MKDANGWEEISTAPKDGTWLMLWEDPGEWARQGCRFGFWNLDQRYVKGGYWGDGGSVCFIATHWQPLPLPPVSAPEGEGKQ